MIVSVEKFKAATRAVGWLVNHHRDDPVGRAARMFGIPPRSLQNYIDHPVWKTVMIENIHYNII